MKAIHERYQILYPLEKGPDARVFLIRDLWQDGTRRVLTLSPLETATRAGRRSFEERFNGRICLVHPALARVHDFAFRGRKIGLVSDFLPGKRLGQQEPSVGTALSLAVQMAELLVFLHRREFYCGVLAPSRIYTTAQGRLTANLLAPHDPQGCGSHCSHVRYAAPEHLKAGCLSVQADLYSLGMLLYHLFTSSPPFFEADAEELLRKQFMADPVPPRKLQADIPEEISQLILALIHKDPELRPESARYALSVLRHFSNLPSRQAPPLKLPLLGREDEILRFRRLAEEFQQDRCSRLVVIEGVAGIGKTRLLRRFESIARLHRLPTYRLAGEESFSVQGQAAQAVFWDDWKPDAAHLAGLEKLLGNATPRIAALTLCKEAGSNAGHHLKKFDGEGVKRLETPLGPLDRLRSRRLVEVLLGECPAEVESRVLDQCSGNPFFLMEFLRQMERTGELKYQEGSWRWSPSALSSRQLPAAVTENVWARIQRLPEQDREIVEVLSLFDRPVPVKMLSELVRRPSNRVENGIRRLERLEMARLGGSLASVLAFVHHQWMRHAVRSALPGRRRRQMHLRIVRHLEGGLAPHPPSALLEALSLHSLLSGDQALSRKYLWPAVEGLQADALNSEAARLLEAAWESRLHVQEDRSICTRLIQLLYKCGKLDQCIQVGRRILNNGAAADDLGNHILTLSVMGRAHLLKGEISQAVQRLESALPSLAKVQALESDNELRSELLGCLALQGEVQRATKLAEQLKSELHRRKDPSFEKVCHALFLFFGNLLDRPEEAAHWETRAIELAYRRGQSQRSLGRLVNLAMLQAWLGWLQRSQSLIRFVRQDASCRQNVELNAFSRLAHCVVLGRQGLHRQAVRQLHKLSSFNRRSNRSRNIEAGIHIELAENFNRLLRPESALRQVEECRRLVNAEYKLDDAVDAALAEAQSWMLMGQSDRARQILAGLDDDQSPVRLVRRRLLLTRLLMLQESYDQAHEQAVKTAGMLGGQRQQEGTSCHLILAEIFLGSRRWPDAQQALTCAFQMTRSGRLPALQAEAYRLQACLEMARRRPQRAKACCLRGLQITARLEDPFRSARLQQCLGQAWLSLKENQRALAEMTRALQFFKQRLFHVQAPNRRAFSKRWIDPIEQDRARALPLGTPVVPRYLTELRQFNSMLATQPDTARLGERLLEAAGECISSSSNVFLRSGGSESFQLVASSGRCLRSGRHLLAWSESPDALLAGKVFSHGNGSFTEIGIRLTQDGRMHGLIYLERPGSAPSEEDLDFLACLAASVELSLGTQARPPDPARAMGSLHPSGVPLVAEHPTMTRLLEEASRIAPTTATVLISGESGTGKELIARAIHAMSTRRQGPFVPVNCSGLTGSLIESELFGHSKGSFTGAGRDRRGLFEAAHRGTLFLDEVATMPTEVQRSLLRALESRSVRRVGETHERQIDLRILSATNQHLARLVEAGAFRRDLYHRLRVCELHVPPLRRRRSDIPLLCRHFLEGLQRDGGRRVQLSKGALALLRRMDFPGNVRELRNLLESAYYLCSGNRIGISDLSARIDPSQDGRASSGPCRKIVEGLIRGQFGFWEDVRDPFLSRDLSRRDVREIISLGLSRCEGNYRRLIELFRLPRDDYKRLMGFLSHHGCKVDFRKFRNS